MNIEQPYIHSNEVFYLDKKSNMCIIKQTNILNNDVDKANPPMLGAEEAPV